MSSSNKNKSKKTDKKIDLFLKILVCAVIIAAIVFVTMIAVILNREEPVVKAPFVAPEFDSEAIEGLPDITDPESEKYREDYGKPYPEEYQERLTFSTLLCGKVTIVDGKADVYFTNPEENTLWMKLRVFDANNNVIAETGLIKPNEYIKTITFDTIPENGTEIKMKIMTYEPDTYYSGGSVSLNTVANVK